MAMTAATADESAATSPVGTAALFHALSEPSRLAILEHLFLGEHRVVDLVTHLGLAQSTVSQHLACLRDCGLVTSRAQGRSSHYSLTDPDRVEALLAEAARLLAATGGAAAAHDGRH
ncbi:metalloregulator ArsR/SmtB family transcription factor [Nocardioides sp.]|uniref:ArsR/SmtB family transcription factor n=1 Tax=Nocardioides sp. TaxID=35761 RepID=UPI002ED63AF3